MHAGLCERGFLLRGLRIGCLMVLAGWPQGLLWGAIKEYKSGVVWPVPKVVDPGTAGSAPADAIVLFDGKDLSAWQDAEKWAIQDGYVEAHGGSITTKQAFGDCQLHLEWCAPEEVSGKGQGRGNSGVYLMGKYEIQILDSCENDTYPDGQAGAVYKQHPPLVNACRKPGQWQTYDILFTAPRFDKAGKLLTPACITLLHNGVVVQNHFELTGDTSYVRAPLYAPHPPKLPLSLQYHRNPVRFRNIWIRELKPMLPLKTAEVDKGSEPEKKPSAKRKTTPKGESPKKSDDKKAESKNSGSPKDEGPMPEGKKSEAKKAEPKRASADSGTKR